MTELQARGAGRPREFEPEQAVQDALETFWARGYHDVSVSDLETATGVVRTSLYNTFTNKRGLFDASLDAYLSTLSDEIARLLTSATGGLSDIHAFLDQIESWHLSGTPGCFMINSMIEFADVDAEITKRGRVYLDHLRSGFSAALQRAATAGELRDPDSLESSANQMLLQTLGLNMAARSALGSEQLKDLYRSAHNAVAALAS